MEVHMRHDQHDKILRQLRQGKTAASALVLSELRQGKQWQILRRLRHKNAGFSWQIKQIIIQRDSFPESFFSVILDAYKAQAL